MKKRFAIYGIGKEYEKQKRYFDKIEVVAYVDNKRAGKRIINGKRVISVNELCEYKFDWIIVVSQKYANEMIK